MHLDLQTVLYAFDLFGTGAFAISGAVRSIDRRPDLVGMLILAGATAVGGSVMRDVILNRDVMVLRDWGYPVVILLATVATFFFPHVVLRARNVFMYGDAIGLGVYSAITASVAHGTPGINPLSVLFIATVTGCGGGVIRDLIIGKESLVLSNELYVTPIIVGSACLMGLDALGVDKSISFVAAMVITTVFRILAIRFKWRMPRMAVPEAQGPER